MRFLLVRLLALPVFLSTATPPERSTISGGCSKEKVFHNERHYPAYITRPDARPEHLVSTISPPGKRESERQPHQEKPPSGRLVPQNHLATITFPSPSWNGWVRASHPRCLLYLEPTGIVGKRLSWMTAQTMTKQDVSVVHASI